MSFLVLFYASGDFKQQFFFSKFLRQIKIFYPSSNNVVFYILKLFSMEISWWLKADKKPSESRRLKSRLSVSAKYNIQSPFRKKSKWMIGTKHFAKQRKISYVPVALFVTHQNFVISVHPWYAARELKWSECK